MRGARAVARGAPHFLREGMRTKVVVLPEGTDPDTYVREHTGEEYRGLLDNAVALIQYEIERAASDLESASTDEKVAAIRDLADLIRVVPSAIYREQYSEKISSDFGLNPDVVREELFLHSSALSHPPSSALTASSEESPKVPFKPAELPGPPLFRKSSCSFFFRSLSAISCAAGRCRNFQLTPAPGMIVFCLIMFIPR